MSGVSGMSGMSEGTAPPLLVRVRLGEAEHWAVRTIDGDAPLPVGLDELLRLPLAQARAAIDAVSAPREHVGELLAPVGSQEVWAAGVTYERSRDGRMEESTEASIYDRVYTAERPEVFFKATGPRVVGDGDAIGVRVDSPWNAPEPELGLVVNADGELFGYVIGNDASSRTIEGENPLYLPQAKVYERACALGPGIVPVWAVEPPFEIRLQVLRGDEVAFEGTTSTDRITRSFEDLIGWLTAALDFPVGAVLLTGTGIVPDESFTLTAGDVVSIEVPGLGLLTNPVVAVGRDLSKEK
jgi:2-dehydro-3-deoxy-D-arabinonate dehydratase